MVFSSTVFLFVFLPTVILLYFIVDKRLRNFLLLLASLFFYAWGEPSFVLAILANITANYIFGICIDKNQQIDRKIWLILALIFNIGMLGYFKYYNFFMDNINNFLKLNNLSTINYTRVALPLGISFFTFQAMSYVIDVYKKEVDVQNNFVDLALYVSLFPQLVAGPIVRYDTIEKELKNRSVKIEDISIGFHRFILGFFKKIVLANTLGKCVDSIFSLDFSYISFLASWLGIICYTLQIYFDFSGYSDMAIGLGRMFGFNFLENFNLPYISKSIREFWRKWHISLSTWFRDYLYIPLGGNRKGLFRTYLNLLIVFFITGLWHGASWNFVLWGLFHGCFLIIERLGFENTLKKLPEFIQKFYTIVIVMIAWVFFRSDNLHMAIEYIKIMFNPFKKTLIGYPLRTFLDNYTIFILILSIFLSFGFSNEFFNLFFKNANSTENGNSKFKSFLILRFSIYIFMFIYAIIRLSVSTYNPFIYFRF